MKTWMPVIALLAGCDSATPAPRVDAGPADVPLAALRGCDPRLFARDAADASSPGPGETYDYVINRLTVDDDHEPGTTTVAFSGFDLDDRRSPVHTSGLTAVDCDHSDFFSTLDPDQDDGQCAAGVAAGGSNCFGGVDNQFPYATLTISQFGRDPTGTPLFDQEINGGRYSVIIRVVGVNGVLGPTLDDPDVTIRVYPVAWPLFLGCDHVQQAQQSYAVDDRSLRTAGDLDAPLMEYSGCIVGGRLRQSDASVTGAPTPMELPLVGTDRVPLHDLHLRFDLGEQAGGNGNLGATALPSEVLTVLRGRLPSPRYEGGLPPLVDGFIDIPFPDPSAEAACQVPNGLISVGLGFTALRAQVQAATVTGPATGACGAP